jgi:hypothetical protein
MITCPGTPFGCPDLYTDDAHVNPPACTMGGFVNFPEVRDNVAAASSLPGVKPYLPVFLTMKQIQGDCGDSVATAASRAGNTTVGIDPTVIDGRPGPFTVAHELGLNMGLNEDTQCTAADARLMCADGQFENATILPSECKQARQNAAIYVQDYWGIKVAP